MTLFFVGRCVATAPKHPPVDVRFTPKSDQMLHCREMTLWARSDHSVPRQKGSHSSASSVRVQQDLEGERPKPGVATDGGKRHVGHPGPKPVQVYWAQSW